MNNTTLYDRDFYAWSLEQAWLLRAGRLSEADIENIAEEVESLGKREQREFENHLAVLLTHLLKWQYQPGHRGSSWQATIRLRRRHLHRRMLESPSLKAVLPEAIAHFYGNANIEAAAETGFLESKFLTNCPWSFDQMMDESFWPEG